jgi:hypothetical protein
MISDPEITKNNWEDIVCLTDNKRTYRRLPGVDLWIMSAKELSAIQTKIVPLGPIPKTTQPRINVDYTKILVRYFMIEWILSGVEPRLSKLRGIEPLVPVE